MARIIPHLWYSTQAEEAAKFYTSIFRNGKIGSIARYPEGSPGPAGSVMTVEFELDGQPFVGLNGGPQFKFNESVSFAIECDTQEEIDHFWDKLLAGGGKPQQCGWLKDRYGLSWQVTPSGMDKLFSDPDPQRAERAMRAMFDMKKLDIETLRRAADGDLDG